MLRTLRIKNLALVTDLTLDFEPGYNVITGETGAGKSILIGALSLVLGERADRQAVRDGSDRCLVEAVFDVGALKAPLGDFLDRNGLEPCENSQLVLKRQFSPGGANRQFVNGSPASLSQLAAIGEWLVDIHGPHDHQSLLQPARQLRILDALGGLETEREAFAQLARKRAEIAAEKSSLIVDEKTYARQLDLLRFQVAEIVDARLQPAEEAQVESEFQRANNAGQILQLARNALQLLAEDDASLLTQAGAVGRTLQELRKLDPGAAALEAPHGAALEALRELQAELSRYVDRTELDPERLQQLEERLNLIQTLKRKYGATLPEVIRFGEEAERKLRQLEQRDAELTRLNAALREADGQLEKQGRELSAQRSRIIPRLAKAVTAQLADLGFKQARFDAVLSELRPSPGSDSIVSTTGYDSIEYQFAPNPGEPPRPLRAIASSGELARVMLALKTVLAAQDEIPVLIFDEVDANVGGETANAVGEKMRHLGGKRQVLCITHLPQVASAASTHFAVTKSSRNGRTVSEVRLLEGPARVEELSRMLGGQTDAARKHAESLLQVPTRSSTGSGALRRRNLAPG